MKSFFGNAIVKKSLSLILILSVAAVAFATPLKPHGGFGDAKVYDSSYKAIQNPQEISDNFVIRTSSSSVILNGGTVSVEVEANSLLQFISLDGKAVFYLLDGRAVFSNDADFEVRTPVTNYKAQAGTAIYVITDDVEETAYVNVGKAEATNLITNEVTEIGEGKYIDNSKQGFSPASTTRKDFSYYPKERGPYNYDTQNVNNDGTFSNPEDRWGGIMRAIESSDFNSTNVEYIEFWMMDPFCEEQDPTNVGQLYFNLGDVSEDILRDGRKAYEHGLPTTAYVENVDTTVWGRVPSLQALVNAFNTDPNSRQYQDIGYDGLNDSDEHSFFSDFLNIMRSKLDITAYEKLSADPSSDDYHYFRGSDLDSDPLYSSILERYKRYNGNEGNSPSETQYNEEYTTNNSTLPDQEDINNDNTLSESENYYQYVIDLDPMKMQASGQNFIADIREAVVQVANGTTKRVKWYQFRIPVREPSRVVQQTACPLPRQRGQHQHACCLPLQPPRRRSLVADALRPERAQHQLRYR